MHLIAAVIQHYHPEWEPPRDTGYPWIKALCPFHAEEHPSASISYQNEAFKCHACGIAGSAVGLIKLQERVSYAEAKRIAEKIAPGCNAVISPGTRGQSRRRVFGETAAASPSGEFPAGLRGRSAPWA